MQRIILPIKILTDGTVVLPSNEPQLVSRLIHEQFPQWSQLPIRAVKESGWDNRTFHLGEHLLVRLPSDLAYAPQVEIEQEWLPYLATKLPLAIPTPLARGMPTPYFPLPWSIYQWIGGVTVREERVTDLNAFAVDLAQFLRALQGVGAEGGPAAGARSFYRGGALSNYDAQTRNAIEILGSKINAPRAVSIWNTALASSWKQTPVWVHGDVSCGNLLLQNGRLHAVIDFGQLSVGDPACDLAIAWTLFNGPSRATFRNALGLDDATWARGRGWVLWKALIVAAKLTETNAIEYADPWRVLEWVFADF
jgi:aminoglycoside phosphotransferase (APT) family kinase protein